MEHAKYCNPYSRSAFGAGAGAGIEPLCSSFFSPFTSVLSAALPLTGFSKICQFLIDAVVVIVVFKVQ